MHKPTQEIFVVDDDVFHLELMQQILRTLGLTSVTAFESGVDCLEEIHQNPDVIFLDHQMDVYSGYETLRKIKRHNPNIFVVMVSAQEDIGTAVDTLKHGAFDYLQKDEKLEENVGAVLGRIEEVRALLRARKPSVVKSLLGLL